jgi:hypothetical protein
MNFKRTIGLFVTCSTLFLAGLPQEKLLAAQCKFQDGKKYTMNGRFGGPSRKNEIVLSSENTVVGNGTSVNFFSGVWRLADGTSGSEEVSVQASASTFIMIRSMDAGLKQIWAGTCQTDNFVTGDIWDPTIGKGSFSMKL